MEYPPTPFRANKLSYDSEIEEGLGSKDSGSDPKVGPKVGFTSLNLGVQFLGRALGQAEVSWCLVGEGASQAPTELVAGPLACTTIAIAVALTIVSIFTMTTEPLLCASLLYMGFGLEAASKEGLGAASMVSLVYRGAVSLAQINLDRIEPHS